jgi:hypothetical protein
MSPRLAASVAALAAGLCLSACGGASTTTMTETVTTAAAGTGRPAGGAVRAQSTGSGTSTETSTAASHQRASAGGGSSRSTSPGSGSAAATPVTEHLVDDTETVHITSHQGAIIVQQGLVTGASIGRGTIVLRNRLGADGVTTSFTVRSGDGLVRGLGTAVLQVEGATVNYRGRARIIGGTGRYSHIRASRLTVTGSGSLSGETTLHVTGVEWY